MELGLTELIEQLKREIGKVQLSGPAMFVIDTVELELKFVVEKNIAAQAKTGWLILAANAKGDYKDQHVNTIKMTLKPHRDLGPLLMANIIDDAINVAGVKRGKAKAKVKDSRLIVS